MYKSDDPDAYLNATVAPKSDGVSQIAALAMGPVGVPRTHEIPRCGSLEDLTNISRSLKGVDVATLAPFDTIVVRTVNSNYRMFLLDPETGRALLDGGRQITEAVEGRVIGSSFGGSILRTGWIGVGLRMEACVDDKYIRTSPVQSLCVEHQTSLKVA
jgi:hypothetical protein